MPCGRGRQLGRLEETLVVATLRVHPVPLLLLQGGGLLRLQDLLQVVNIPDGRTQRLDFAHLLILGGTGDVLTEGGEGGVDMLDAITLAFVATRHGGRVRLVAQFVREIHATLTSQHLLVVVRMMMVVVVVVAEFLGGWENRNGQGGVGGRVAAVVGTGGR